LLIETIRNQSVRKVSREEVAQEMARVLGEIEKVRLADLEDRVDAELRKLGITCSGEVDLLRLTLDKPSISGH